MPLLVWGAELVLPAITSCITSIACGALTGVVAYGGYKFVEAINQPGYSSTGIYGLGNLEDWLYTTIKSGSVDPSLPSNPDDLLKRPGWKEITHPEAGKKGHRTFENEETGEILRHDDGKAGYPGHKAHDHYHRPNPKAVGKHDEYLDGNGNPVPDGHDNAHIYSSEKVWWL